MQANATVPHSNCSIKTWDRHLGGAEAEELGGARHDERRARRPAAAEQRAGRRGDARVDQRVEWRGEPDL